MSPAQTFAAGLRKLAIAPDEHTVAVWVAEVCSRLNRAADVIEAQEIAERENTHLRVTLQDRGHCPYGHFKATSGCELGYPGCACMDDLLALQAWCPEDEEKAAVRIGRLLFTTRALLDEARLAMDAAAAGLETGDPRPVLAAALRAVAKKPVSLAP